MLNLIKETFACSKKTSNLGIYVFVTLSIFIVDCVSGIAKPLIAKNDNMKWLYIICIPILSLMRSFHSVVARRFCCEIETVFLEKNYQKYDRLTTRSKYKYGVQLDEDKAMDAVGFTGRWLVNTIVETVPSVVSCIVLFSVNGIYMFLKFLCLVVSITLIYLFKILKQQKNLTKKRKNFKAEDKESQNLLQLYRPMFQFREKTVSDMMELESVSINNSAAFMCEWNKICMTLISVVEIFNIISLVSSNKATFICILSTTGQLQMTIFNIIEFFNRYFKLSDDYDTYESKWKDMVFGYPEEKLDIPKVLIVSDISIKLGNSKTVTGSSDERLVINQGSKILVRGASGSGKTTFINALMGKIDGVTLVGCAQPQNITHHFVDLYQHIREVIPTTNITIRQLFENECNDSLITRCLDICEIKEWGLDIGYDSKIEARNSGGEKTRLCIAMRIYKMIKENASVLVLDEIEQGIDNDMAVRITNRIFDMFHNKTIILISHLCRCRLDQIIFTHEINVNDGKVSWNYIVDRKISEPSLI